ncbi:G-protein coupled receptor GRL101, partial [Biomphalaria glabrata]
KSESNVQYFRTVTLSDFTSSIKFDSSCLIFNFTVDCSRRNLKQINSSWFPNTNEVILLNDNLLIKLNNFTFSHLVKLKVLNISNNKISVIEPLSFE